MFVEGSPQSGMSEKHEKMLHRYEFPSHKLLQKYLPLKHQIDTLMAENKYSEGDKKLLPADKRQELKKIVANDPEFKKQLEGFVFTKFFIYFYNNDQAFHTAVDKSAEAVKLDKSTSTASASRVNKLFNIVLKRARNEDSNPEFKKIEAEFQLIQKAALSSNLSSVEVRTFLEPVVESTGVVIEPNIDKDTGYIKDELKPGNIDIKGLTAEERDILVPDATTGEIERIMVDLVEEGYKD